MADDVTMLAPGKRRRADQEGGAAKIQRTGVEPGAGAGVPGAGGAGPGGDRRRRRLKQEDLERLIAAPPAFAIPPGATVIQTRGGGLGYITGGGGVRKQFHWLYKGWKGGAPTREQMGLARAAFEASSEAQRKADLRKTSLRPARDIEKYISSAKYRATHDIPGIDTRGGREVSMETLAKIRKQRWRRR